MTNDESRQFRHRTAKLVLFTIVVILVGYGFGAYGGYVTRCHVAKLRHSVETLRPDSTGRFKYALVDESAIVEQLRRRGAVAETADCLAQLLASPNRLSRHAATLLLLDLEEGAALGLPVLERTALDETNTQAVRDDSRAAIRMIEDHLCRRTLKPSSPQTRSNQSSGESSDSP